MFACWTFQKGEKKSTRRFNYLLTFSIDFLQWWSSARPQSVLFALLISIIIIIFVVEAPKVDYNLTKANCSSSLFVSPQNAGTN